jgi:hypothetical protein
MVPTATAQIGAGIMAGAAMMTQSGAQHVGILTIGQLRMIILKAMLQE